MAVTAGDWDARVDRLSARLPSRLQAVLRWLREPSRWFIRLPAALLFIAGGILSILPVLGLWMLPVGLALLSQDAPALKVPLEHAARWLEMAGRRLHRRWRQGQRRPP